MVNNTNVVTKRIYFFRNKKSSEIVFTLSFSTPFLHHKNKTKCRLAEIIKCIDREHPRTQVIETTFNGHKGVL